MIQVGLGAVRVERETWVIANELSERGRRTNIPSVAYIHTTRRCLKFY